MDALDDEFHSVGVGVWRGCLECECVKKGGSVCGGFEGVLMMMIMMMWLLYGREDFFSGG